MGIPKFFRYISERWPNISQLIDGTQIPEFDNLYLDMNSILHSCTHGNDDDVKKRLSEEEVFMKIFAYIDHLFNTIKPKEVFYMAIDGVAPRAKMNQQRARRFRTAMDAEKALERALRNEEPIPQGEPFDSNAITPGTEFMAKLTKNLKYFIHDKISNDSLWQSARVILSGHEVPGEGEHKIMEFIRSTRAQASYNPNTRHCIYGLDADLIILGLSTHDYHFALLREEVVFGKAQKAKPLEQQNFYLLHLSILREYLELEFSEVENLMMFDFEFEKILDDFILVLFVIGNDFLPNLPDLHLNKGAFPVLLQTFKEALKHMDGYMNDCGKINMKRLAVWMNQLSLFERLNFEQEDVDVEWFNKQLENISLEGERKRNRVGKKMLLKGQKKIVGAVKPWLLKTVKEIPSKDVTDEQITMKPALQDTMSEGDVAFLKDFALELGLILVHSPEDGTYTFKMDLDSFGSIESQEDRNELVNELRRSLKKFEHGVIVDSQQELEKEKALYNKRFDDWKDSYYLKKLNFSYYDKEQLKAMTENYVEGLQWVLYYYYRGCPSWSWYYHYHYAPRISDIVMGTEREYSFEADEPAKPFQQLLAVLPERSKNLIPPVYRPLMYDEKSPILDFYPKEVELDKNGKTADWEAVVKLPFVDRDRLVEAMEPYDKLLNPIERERNGSGFDIEFMFNPQVDDVYKTPLKGLFRDVSNNHCVEQILKPLLVPEGELVFGLPKGAKLGLSAMAGFPSLKTLPFTSRLEYNECRIFQRPSKQQSMLLFIQDVYKANNLNLDNIAEMYINSIVYTNWPYLREAKLIGLYSQDHTYQIASNPSLKFTKRSSTPSTQKWLSGMLLTMKDSYSKSNGIILDKIDALVKVLPVNGLARQPDGSYQKTFSDVEEFYPLQLVVDDVENKDHRFAEKPPLPIESEFPKGTSVIFLGDYAYGGEAIIKGYSSKTRLKLTVNKRSTKTEPVIGKVMARKDSKVVKYLPVHIMAKNIGVSPLFLSRITSKFLIKTAKGQVNVGIMVKFNNQNEKVLGYARKVGMKWEYSTLTLKLLQEYKSAFPEFFSALSNSSRDIPSMETLFPSKSPDAANKMLAQVVEFVKNSRQNFVTVSLESDSLTRVAVATVEAEIKKFSQYPDKPEKKALARVPREAVLDPKKSFTLFKSQSFELGDRVMYVQDSGAVPLFSRGTVVGYMTLGKRFSVQVLFDHEIVAGTTLGGRLTTNRGMGLDSSCLLNLTKRQFIYHSKASMNATSEANRKPQSQQNNTSNKAKAAELKRQHVKNLLSAIKNDAPEPKQPENDSSGAAPPSSNAAKPAPAQFAPNDHANNVYNAVINQFASPGHPVYGLPMPEQGMIPNMVMAPNKAMIGTQYVPMQIPPMGGIMPYPPSAGRGSSKSRKSASSAGSNKSQRRQ